MTTTGAADLHGDAVVVDAHNDLLMCVVARPPAEWGAYFRSSWLPQLRAGGVDVQVLPVFVDATAGPELALRTALRTIEAAHRIAEENADAVSLCGDAPAIEAALAAGRIALVPAMEGLAPIAEDVVLIATLHRLGVRVASFTHFGRTALADGSAEDAAGSRLTAGGVEAIAEMERLGVLLDVSHLGVEGVDHALEVATRPVIATHSCARSLCDHHRNLTDDQLAAIAATGGVVCVNFYGPFVHEDEYTLGRVVDQIEAVAGVTGADRVGLGPDFMRQLFAELEEPWRTASGTGTDPATFVPSLEGPEGLAGITRELLRRGWSEPGIRGVLGLNVMRLFRDELGVAAATSRRETG